MIHRRVLLPLLVVLPLGACGDDGGGAPDASVPDAEVPDPDATPRPACAELGDPAATISSYPGSAAGTVVGAGADLQVAEGVCTVEGDPGDPSYYAPIGEDAVVALAGLTPGTRYGVVLDSADDLGFYVITGCDEDAGGPVAGQCHVFDDRTALGERHSFTPDAADAFVVVDTANVSGPPETGDFTLRVLEVECDDAAQCAAPTPVCSDFECVECATSFDCTSAASPVCDPTGACVAGPAECTGDDAGDDGGGDDGPAGARLLATPTVTPTVATGAVCSLPAGEADWYELVVAAGDTFGIELAFSDVDLGVQVLDDTGAVRAQGRAFTADLAPGTYYLVVAMSAPADTAAAASYTLTVRRAECATAFDCPLVTEPVCSSSGACLPGPGACVDDDAADQGNGDDGPAVARDLTGAVDTPVALEGAVCNAPPTEHDFYAVTVLPGEGLVVTLDWTGTENLDLAAFDAGGALHGLATRLHPETVTLTYLPAGTYYLRVSRSAPNAITAVIPYTITATRTAAQTCAGPADCAAVHATQVYRGACAAGVCDFIPPGARTAGAACDSGDDCSSAVCSYVVFEADASESVCTDTCGSEADCAAIGDGLTCSVGSLTMCTPSCTTDLDCGANLGSSGLDKAQPWDYYACNPDTGVCTY